MNAQDKVAQAVRERGYYEKPNGDPWTSEQLAARQVAKLAEELGELVECIAAFGWDGHRQRYGYEWLLEGAVRQSARDQFDSDHWHGAVVLNAYGAASELADLQVVLFTLADALGVDAVELAVEKAERDKTRGVR